MYLETRHDLAHVGFLNIVRLVWKFDWKRTDQKVLIETHDFTEFKTFIIFITVFNFFLFDLLTLLPGLPPKVAWKNKQKWSQERCDVTQTS